MALQTKPEPLEIAGSSLKLRYHPLPTDQAIDEFAKLGSSFENSGALTLLIEAGSGIGFNPASWDIGDVSLIFKALLKALSTGDSDVKPSDMLRDICTRYGVQLWRDESWVSLGADISELGTDLPFVAFACLSSSITPFINRLSSLAAAKAVAQAKNSSDSTPES